MPLKQHHIIDFFCIAIITTMVFSPYALTLSMIGLAAVGVFTFSPKWRPGINWSALSHLLRPWRYPAFLVITLLFWITFIGVWNLEEVSYFKARLRIKLPYLLLPLLFMVLPPFTTQKRNFYLLYLLVLITLTSIGVLINYGLHAESINSLIEQGKPMPTPRNHIRFSLLVVLAIIAGGYLTIQRIRWKFKIERYLIPSMTFFLFIFAHILSVKTGLLVLYVVILFSIFRYLFFSRNYIIAIISLVAITALPFVAYHTVPSFKAKVNYTRYDLFMYKHERGEVFGDAGRIISLQVGWQIFKEHPLLGAGAGNLHKTVEEKFKSEQINYWETLMPHNQFLFIMAATGLIGLAIFLFAFIFPLIYQQAYKDFLILIFHLLLLPLFMVDHPCETSLGVAYHSFFLLLFLSASKSAD
jgi:O-antigen ligase